MKIQIENLKAQIQGRKLNIYQKADAVIEFNKLLNYVEELEQCNASPWNNMETAPKDGSRILIKNDEGIVYVAAWVGYKIGLSRTTFYNWVIPESWQDEQGGYFEIDNPIGWMHCPK